MELSVLVVEPSKGHSGLEHATLFESVKKVVELEGIKVTVEDLTSISMGGYYQPGNNTIHISDKEQDTRAAVVMLPFLFDGVVYFLNNKPLPTQLT